MLLNNYCLVNINFIYCVSVCACPCPPKGQKQKEAVDSITPSLGNVTQHLDAKFHTFSFFFFLNFVALGLLSSCSARAQSPCSMWDLSTLTRNRIYIPHIGRWIFNQWATREVPTFSVYLGTSFPIFRNIQREFPGGPAVRTLHFHHPGNGFNPWLGN